MTGNRPHRSGDPRRRAVEEAMHLASTQPMFWQQFRHGCGCYLEWGTPVPDQRMSTYRMAQETMFMFFRSIACFPCPMHGSATGVPAAPLENGVRRYMPANNIWYRECPPDRHVYADRVSDELIQVPDLREEEPEDYDEADAYEVDPHNPNDPTNC